MRSFASVQKKKVIFRKLQWFNNPARETFCRERSQDRVSRVRQRGVRKAAFRAPAADSGGGLLISRYRRENCHPRGVAWHPPHLCSAGCFLACCHRRLFCVFLLGPAGCFGSAFSLRRKHWGDSRDPSACDLRWSDEESWGHSEDLSSRYVSLPVLVLNPRPVLGVHGR